MQLARKISPSMVIGPMHAPHVLAPLVAMAQVLPVHVSCRGHCCNTVAMWC